MNALHAILIGLAVQASGVRMDKTTNAWAVLVVGGDPGPLNGGHLGHFSHICRAYEAVAPQIDNKHIILIGDFTQALKLFQMPSAPTWIKSKRMEFLTECGSVLQKKPYIYDGPMVNPATLMRVLRGEPSETVPVVINCGGDCTVFLAVDTHGWHSAPRSLWYARLPYKVEEREERERWYGKESEAAKLHDFGGVVDGEDRLIIPNAGANISRPDKIEFDSRADRYSLIFRAHYLSAFRKLKRDGCKGILALNQWCGSGGFVDLFRSPKVMEEELPVAMISPTDSLTEAGGTLPNYFYPKLVQSLAPAAAETTVLDFLTATKKADDKYQDDSYFQERTMYITMGMVPPLPSVGRSEIVCVGIVCSKTMKEFFPALASSHWWVTPETCPVLLNDYLELKAQKNEELRAQLQAMIIDHANVFWQQFGANHDYLKSAGCAIPDAVVEPWHPKISY